jgi:thiamine-phosphate pyrophosphorylase
LLVLLTDDARLPDPLAAARALPRASLVIVRARDAKRRALLAVSLLRVAKARGLVLLVADDPMLARRIGAHGLHLPELRAHEAGYWRARFPRLYLTAAAHSLRAAWNMNWIDAALLSPVFASESHPGAASLTAARARLMARQVRLPLIALGGINARNAGLLKGFAGIAAIGALAERDS